MMRQGSTHPTTTFSGGGSGQPLRSLRCFSRPHQLQSQSLNQLTGGNILSPDISASATRSPLPKHAQLPSAESPGKQRFGCPIFEHQRRLGLKTACRTLVADNVSGVRRHLERSHKLFVFLCGICNEDFMDYKNKEEGQDLHESGCSNKQTQRRGEKAQEQYDALYEKIVVSLFSFNTESTQQLEMNPSAAVIDAQSPQPPSIYSPGELNILSRPESLAEPTSPPPPLNYPPLSPMANTLAIGTTFETPRPESSGEPPWPPDWTDPASEYYLSDNDDYAPSSL